MRNIHIHPVLFLKLLRILVFTLIPIFTVAYLYSNIDKFYFWFIYCGVFIFFVIIIFYLNRFSPENMIFSDNKEVRIDYFNKLLFRTKSINISLDDITITEEVKIITLKSNQDKTLAVIQKSSISQDDLIFLTSKIKSL